MSEAISRRQFGKFVISAGLSASVGLAAFRATRDPLAPECVLADLSTGYRKASEVAHAFVTAPSPVLMVYYSLFFPEFLRLKGLRAISDLQLAAVDLKTRHSLDHHRLDALPPAAACHLLKSVSRDADREELTSVILGGLNSEKREVKEIVLQNLIAATALDADSLRYFSVHADLLLWVRELLEKAEDDIGLTTPALLATEFLLNASSLVAHGGRTESDLIPYQYTLERARAASADHLWIIPSLIEEHRAVFPLVLPDGSDCLPPHSSEALMCFKNLPLKSMSYVALLALSRAQLLRSEYKVLTGARSGGSTSSEADARRAVPKIIAFLNGFGLTTLIRNQLDSFNVRDAQLIDFCRNDLPLMCSNPSGFGLPDEECILDKRVQRIAEYSPFHRYNDHGILLRAQREDKENRTKAKYTAYGAFITSEYFLRSHAYLAKIFWGSKANSDVDGVGEGRAEIDEKIQEGAQELEERSIAIDRGEYAGLDQQQQDLGDLEHVTGDITSEE